MIGRYWRSPLSPLFYEKIEKNQNAFSAESPRPCADELKAAAASPKRSHVSQHRSYLGIWGRSNAL